MHNRRFGAFLMGAWLLGTVLVWFATSQAVMTVDRILSATPAPVQKEFNDMGPEVARQILAYEANEFSRRVIETWAILQLGLASALLANSVFTSSRSKTMVICSFAMTILSCISALYLAPAMTALARVYDFLPAGAAMREREEFQRLDVWHRVLGVLNTILALALSGRLLFDFYEFGTKLIPDLHKGKRRRRRRSGLGSEASASGTAEAHQRPSPNA
jgi:hypothetical protein